MVRLGLMTMTMVVLAAAATARADTTWSGTLSCGIIPGLTTRPLRTPITVTVADGQASYRREVHKADSSGYSGYFDQGTGPVGADGKVTINGGAVGRGVQMTATFQGVLPPAGGAARLTGTQLWTTRRTGQEACDCSMDLRR